MHGKHEINEKTFKEYGFYSFVIQTGSNLSLRSHAGAWERVYV